MTMGFTKIINLLNILELIVVVPLTWYFMVYLKYFIFHIYKYDPRHKEDIDTKNTIM